MKFKHYRKFLMPFSYLYQGIINFRHMLFNMGVLKTRSFKTPTINVGNLALGGTGKTPHIEYLIRFLSEDYRVATLSRGYKRKTKGFILADNHHSFEDIGDEPKQLKTQFPNILVSVDANRCRGVEQLEHLSDKPDIILLDDAYQHRYINPGFNILLTDYSNPFWEDDLLPAGNLRDSKGQVRRADVVLITKTPEEIKPIQKRIIKKHVNLFPYQHLFFTNIKYGKLVSIGSGKAPERTSGYSALMLTGIANPSHLEHYLSEHFQELIPFTFPDHYAFKESDFDKILQKYEGIQNEYKIIVTTLKDAVRLKDNVNFAKLVDLPIFYQSIEIGFFDESDQKKFNELILKYVRKSKRNS